MEAGARLEEVSWEDGEEKPANDTGPELWSLVSGNYRAL